MQAKLDSLSKFFNVFKIKCVKASLLQRVANFLHQRIVKIDVVHDRQTHRQHLAGLEQMVQVSAAEAAAHRAVALGIQRGIVQRILGVEQISSSLPGEQVGMARIPGGHDAVEEIDAAANGFQNVVGVPTPIR